MPKNFFFREKILWREEREILRQIIVFFARACYNVRMVKAKITGLALAGVLALSGACVGIFARRAKAEADAASVSLTTSNAELVLPAGDSQAGYTA